MIAQDELKGYPSKLVDLWIIRDNDHAFFCGRSAGRMELGLLFYLDQTYAANTI
jgi:hypothetical protein